MKSVIVLLTTFLFSSMSTAHPGRLNVQGCHNDRSTGTMHCHRSSEVRPPPVSVQRSDSGTRDKTAIFYQNCAAVRAAGAAPIRRGQPGYGSHLDRDNDGVACE